MGKYFIPVLPGPSPATNQDTVPGPPVPVKLAKTLYHSGPDRIQIPKGPITCADKQMDMVSYKNLTNPS